jgi:hypothetical protein
MNAIQYLLLGQVLARAESGARDGLYVAAQKDILFVCVRHPHPHY